MIHDRNSTLDQFLSATAARQPTPGGGSVAALAGALAAAIGEMALNYSLGKKDLLQYQPQLAKAVHELQRARELLLQLMVEDQAAFQAMTTIRKLPHDSAERTDRLPAAILTCIRVPQSIAITAIAILELAHRVVGFVNPYLLSDLAVGAELAMATVRSAIYNCRINLADIIDAADRKSIESMMSGSLDHATQLIQQLLPAIWARLEKK